MKSSFHVGVKVGRRMGNEAQQRRAPGFGWERMKRERGNEPRCGGLEGDAILQGGNNGRSRPRGRVGAGDAGCWPFSENFPAPACFRPRISI